MKYWQPQLVFVLVMLSLVHILVMIWTSFTADTVERLATENAQMRLTDNRMLRSRTNYTKPGLQAWDYRGVSACAAAVGWPSTMLMAARRTENGGMLLDLGIQWIPPNIREDYPPSMWQYAAAQQILVEEAGKFVLRPDHAIFDQFANQLAKRWKAKDPAAWRRNFKLFVKKYRQTARRNQGRNADGGK